MIDYSRAYALTMTKPHEALGLHQPIARQLARHSTVVWYVLIWAMIFVCTLAYVGFITASSARGFQLRDAEARLERLQGQARTLETEVARVSSIQAMTDRADEMGFVAVSQVEAVNAAGHSYAFAR